MNFQKFFLLTVLVAFFVPTVAFAKDSFNINILKVEGQGMRCLEDAKARGISPVAACLLVAIDYLSLTIGSVALLIFIVGALITIASEGREDRLEKGKSAMMYSIYGILVAFTAYLITTFVQSILYQ